MICNAETTQQLTNGAIALANINNIKHRHALITVYAIEILIFSVINNLSKHLTQQ